MEIDLEIRNLFGVFATSLWLFPLLLFTVLALFSRGAPDPEGERAHVVYLGFALLVSLAVFLFNGFRAVEAAVAAAVVGEGSGLAERRSVPVFPEDGGSPGFDFFGGGGGSRDPLIAAAVAIGAVAAAAAVVYAFHLRRLEPLREGLRARQGVWSTYQAFLYAVCFLTVITALFAAALAAGDLFRLVEPDIAEAAGFRGPPFAFGDVDLTVREAATARLIAAGGLTAASVALFVRHWREVALLRAPEPVPPVTEEGEQEER